MAQISLTAENAYMQANKTSAACLIANYEKATIKGNRIQAGATIVNSGYNRSKYIRKLFD